MKTLHVFVDIRLHILPKAEIEGFYIIHNVEGKHLMLKGVTNGERK